MILVSIGMAVQWWARQSYLPTAVDDLWIDRHVRQAETKHSLQYARYHEMIPKMMYIQQHTTTRSIKRQPTQLVDLDEAWRPRQGSVCLHSLHSAVRGICAKKDNSEWW
jgi:hypothetical protein